jgi:ATP-binding cassette subfamily B protein RaxB
MQSIRVIQDIVLRGVIGALIDGIMACVALALLFFYSTELAAIVVIAFSVIGIANYAFYSLIRQKTEVQLAAAAKEQTFLMETIRAVTAIKLLGKEIERESTWKNMFIRSTNMSMEVSRIQIKLNVIQNIIEGAQYTAIVYFSAKMIIEAKGFSVGMMMAFLSYRQTFVNGANAFIYQFNQMRLVRLHVERLGDIITQEPEEISDCSISPRIDGDVRFKNVSFRYGATDTNVLLDINMHIKRGEFVAIVGASGCGKSTLLKLLVGLYIPTSGEIEIDGTLASAEKWRAWRKSIGIVGQDDRLFSGSISENIAVFDANIDMERVIESAKSAQIHDEILLKPMQYQTLIGDMGAALSGGQKQRILLARSIYRNPRLLILDEGTANLDRNSETLIADYVSSLNITRIVVAHRPALVERADRVFNLANGKILEVSKSDIVQSIP